MAQWSAEAEQILRERFGGDSLISLATTCGGIPYVRTVNPALAACKRGSADRLEKLLSLLERD